VELHAWMNGFGKLRRCTDERKVVVEFTSTWPTPSP
jgi:hypothetical protein